MEIIIVNIFSKRPFINTDDVILLLLRIQRMWQIPVFLMFLRGDGDGIWYVSILYCKMVTNWNIYIWGI